MRPSLLGNGVFVVLIAGTLLVFGEEEGSKSSSGVESSSVKGAPTATERTGGASDVASPDGRMREGSKLVEQIGEFQKAGDQVNFYLPNRKTELPVLPNLALERVVRVLEDNPALRTWSVSGVITEFQGGNYLLVTRAVLKARPTQPVTRKRRLPAEGEKAE